MRYELIQSPSQEQYDRFVSEHASGSFLQSWDWGEWMRQNGKTPFRFAVVDANQKIIFSAQVLVSPIPKIGKRYLYIPHGPLLADNADSEVINFFIGQLNQIFNDALFLRIEPKQAIKISGSPTKKIQPGKTLVLDLTKTSEQLLSEMHHKTRYNIKVAQKHKVRMKISYADKAGFELIGQTAKRQGYKSHSLDYYQNLVQYFRNRNGNTQAIVYSAEYRYKTLASGLMIDFGNTRTYLFGGTSEEHRNVMAPYLMHWQAIQDAKNDGLKQYDFWGIETASGAAPGFVRFKLGWGGTQTTYPNPVDLIFKPSWYSIYKLFRYINRLI